MPRFNIKYVFKLRFRNQLILAGSVVTGVIRQGMYVHIPANASSTLTARIQAIEFALRTGGHEDVCLCIPFTPDHAETLLAKGFGDVECRVSEDG